AFAWSASGSPFCPRARGSARPSASTRSAPSPRARCCWRWRPRTGREAPARSEARARPWWRAGGRGRCPRFPRTRSPNSSPGADMIQIGYAHRQAPMARRGMVAACHPLASLAGVEVLKGGGNVVDAAIATNAVLAVTQPNYCGVGGDFFCLYHEAATGRVHCYNGAGRSGWGGGLEERGRRALSAVPAVGPGAVSVPGVTEAWHVLLERFGTRSLGRLLEPAIHYAAEG